MENFTFSRLPYLHFGTGTFIPAVKKSLSDLGVRKLAVVTGGGSFRASSAWSSLLDLLRERSIVYHEFRVHGEPSPDLVDAAASDLRGFLPDAILAIGGGSVIDAGKAVSAMTVSEGSITEYLEGVGTKTPSGRKVPMIAVPTTAGTGSEATKNAVISRIGEHGFKKSLRHDNYIPEVAVIDPALAVTCPPAVTAASGLDAITQLLEAYLSTGSSPMSDALARSGLESAGKHFIRVFENGDDLEARSGLAYAAWLSGVCLANAGLGVVHGIASPLGAMFDIPHGVVCGSLLSSAIGLTVEKILEREGEGSPVFVKLADAGRLLTGENRGSTRGNVLGLIETLEFWTVATGIPRLGEYGLQIEDAERIAKETALKTHPVALSVEDVAGLLRERI